MFFPSELEEEAINNNVGMDDPCPPFIRAEDIKLLLWGWLL